MIGLDVDQDQDIAAQHPWSATGHADRENSESTASYVTLWDGTSQYIHLHFLNHNNSHKVWVL